MRKVVAISNGIPQRKVMRVAELSQLAVEWRPGLSLLIPASSRADVDNIQRLRSAGLFDIAVLTKGEGLGHDVSPVVVSKMNLVAGDVVAVTPGHTELQVLYRESYSHHTVFLTNRCNSRCIMCSQPPTRHDDSWLIEEAASIAAHIRRPPAILGFTGGEPLLLGARLRGVIDTFAEHHPATSFDVLTNGRMLAERAFAKVILDGMTANVSWMVPLYGHADFLHDYVVQAEGAFDQTIDRLLTLQSFGQAIQLRIVLIEPVLRVLPDLCSFISRNLPFVREVALMGCEPIGFALANRAECEVDILQWTGALSSAVRRLTMAGIPTILMNLPLCALPADLRRLAHRSISDWKQVYASECASCDARTECCGLFAWHERGWRPTALRPIKELQKS